MTEELAEKVAAEVIRNESLDVDEEVIDLSLKKDLEDGDTSSSSSSASSTQECSSCASNNNIDDEDDDRSSELSFEESSQEDLEYPGELYCPITYQLFSNPVVAADGESYEKAAYSQSINKTEDDQKHQCYWYPNRALKIIIDDAVMNKSGSIQASFKRLQYVAMKAVDDFLDRPQEPSSADNPDSSNNETEGWDIPLSDGFYCPVTFNIFHEPVIDPDGNTFEKVAVENWIRLHGTSPVTRNSLSIEQLYPNHIIRRLLEAETQKPEDQMHPDILKWKEEPAPNASDLEYGGGEIAAADAAAAAATTDLSGSSPLSAIAEQRRRRYRRRMARRQLIYNVTGMIICFVLLKFVLGTRA